MKPQMTLSNGKNLSITHSDIELSDIRAGTPATELEEPLLLGKPITSERREKWKLVLLLNSGLALVVFLINTVITTLAFVKGERSDTDGSIVLMTGDCTVIKHFNTASHLLINLCSTLLLMASSYGMQTLSAPTRSDVDVAHAKRKNLDIGILSVRNLRYISRKKALLCMALAISSLPLHLW